MRPYRQLVLSNEENVRILIEAWKVMVGRLPGSTIDHSGGLATMFGQVPLQFLNLSAPDRPMASETDLSDTLERAKARERLSKHPSFVALCEEWVPPGWERIGAHEGYSVLWSLTGMAADQLLPPRRGAPELEFQRVQDERTARDIAMINAQAYDLPPEQFESICNLHLWRGDHFAFVGYEGGRRVTSAAAFPVAGTLYVGFVATAPEAQGKGYAEAVMRKAVEEGRKASGLTRIALHASESGRPLYQSMGFVSGAKVVMLAASEV